MVLLLLMLFYLLVSFRKTGNYFPLYCLHYLLLVKSVLLNLQVLLVYYYFILMELQMMPLFEVFYTHQDQIYFLGYLITIYQELMKPYLIFVMIAFCEQTFLHNFLDHPRLFKMDFFLLDIYHHYLLINFLIKRFYLEY